MDATLDNYVRLAVLFLCIIVGFSMLSVMVMHYGVYRRQRARGYDGLLPLHVALIALSYGLFTYGLGDAMVQTLNTPISWRIYLYGAGLFVGEMALLIVGHLQRRKLRTEMKREASYG